MLHTEKTDQAYKLLSEYARTPEQHVKVNEVYIDTLAAADSEDTVVMYLLGSILDGLRYGNWFWNMPPSAQTVSCPEHGHPHTYGSSSKPNAGQF